MTLGIVGSEGKKFTRETEALARARIRALIAEAGATRVVSGACHLGGIDVWAIQEAKRLGLDTQEFPPRVQSWEYGYKPRNIQIADASDAVVCLTLRTLPESYNGMTFPLCYHCGTKDHVKSGGCWTTKYARRAGKRGWTEVIGA